MKRLISFILLLDNAYMEVMSMETELVPWIIKQTQKGPPDAWFGKVTRRIS